MDLKENSDGRTVSAIFELPGLRKEDVSIDVHNSLLTVSGESGGSTVTEEEERGYVVRERRAGKFSRTVRLPQGIKVGIFYSGTNST
jgi:HSP20 family protein